MHSLESTPGSKTRDGGDVPHISYIPKNRGTSPPSLVFPGFSCSGFSDHFRADQARIQQRLQFADNESAQTADPQNRQELSELLASLKQEAGRSEKSAQQSQTLEGELANRLQSERVKLTDLNDRLDQMERVLNTP
jgi:hypothetical protein